MSVLGARLSRNVRDADEATSHGLTAGELHLTFEDQIGIMGCPPQLRYQSHNLDFDFACPSLIAGIHSTATVLSATRGRSDRHQQCSAAATHLSS
jgi:hypothetical protein